MCVHASGIRRGLWFTAPLPAHRVLGTASHFLECKSGIIECGECDQNTTLFLLLPSTGVCGGSRCLLCHVQTSFGGSQALGAQLNLSPSLARQHPSEYHHTLGWSSCSLALGPLLEVTFSLAFLVAQWPLCSLHSWFALLQYFVLGCSGLLLAALLLVGSHNPWLRYHTFEARMPVWQVRCLMNEHLGIPWCCPSGGQGFGVNWVRWAAGFKNGVGVGKGSEKKPRRD